MAVTTVTASLAGVATNQIFGGISNPAAWLTDVRNATEGTSRTVFNVDGSGGTTGTTAFQVSYQSVRGSLNGTITRAFIFFGDINTAVGGGTITGATLQIKGLSGGSTTLDSIIVSASAYGGDGSEGLANTTDFSKLSFSDPYSSTLTSWNDTDYNNYVLNADAVSDMNADGYLNCAIINDNSDFDGVTPTLGQVTQSRASVSLTNPVNLVITYTATATNVSVTQSIVVSSGNLTAGTPVTYSIDNPLSASSYFVLETTRNADGFYDSNSPKNLEGTFTLGTGITDVVSDDYKAGAVVAPGGGNLVFTPTNNVTAATLLLKGTRA